MDPWIHNQWHSQERGLRHPPGPHLNGVWGGGPAGFGVEPQLPAYMIQSSHQVRSAASCQIWLNPVWRVGCEGELRASVARPNGPRVSSSEAEDRSPPNPTGFRQIWRRRGETKPLILYRRGIADLAITGKAKNDFEHKHASP